MPNKIETRGRKALPPEQRKSPQATVKINETILPFVKQLKDNLKNEEVTQETLRRLFDVLNNDFNKDPIFLDDVDIDHTKNEVHRLKDELKKQVQLNAITPLEPSERLQLSDRYHTEHLKVVRLESREKSNEHTIKTLKSKIHSLECVEHNCQSLKANGQRCNRPSKVKANFHGVLINVCLQHSKTLSS